MATPRPRCVHCGCAYGNRATTTETVRWPLGEEMPAYRGNGILIKTGQPYTTANRETVRGVTALSVNPEIRAKQEADIARAPEKSQRVAYREIWDGQSWRGGYSPFCTLRCALEYARIAYRKAVK